MIFILATTEVHKIPITILSRCQRYDFKRISIETITDRMRELMQTEGVDVEEKALRFVAKAADGSMRDALSLLDQCIAFHFGSQLTYDKVLDVLGAVDTSIFSRMLRLIVEKNIIGAIDLLEEMIIQGRELGQFVSDFTWYLRNLLLAASSDSIEDVIDMSSDNLQNLKEEAQMLELPVIMRYIRIFSELSDKIRYASQKRILLEMTIIKLCKPDMEAKNDTLLDRIRSIEQQLKEGVVMARQPGMADADGSGTGMGAAGASGMNPGKAKPELPKAIPEDVKKLVGRWQSVVGSTSMPMKQYLREARLTLGGDNRLLIVLPDGLESDYFLKNPENMELLNRLLSDSIGKEVEASVQAMREDRAFEEVYPDLESVIHMEIEEEE